MDECIPACSGGDGCNSAAVVPDVSVPDSDAPTVPEAECREGECRDGLRLATPLSESEERHFKTVTVWTRFSRREEFPPADLAIQNEPFDGPVLTLLLCALRREREREVLNEEGEPESESAALERVVDNPLLHCLCTQMAVHTKACSASTPLTHPSGTPLPISFLSLLAMCVSDMVPLYTHIQARQRPTTTHDNMEAESSDTLSFHMENYGQADAIGHGEAHPWLMEPEWLGACFGLLRGVFTAAVQQVGPDGWLVDQVLRVLARLLSVGPIPESADFVSQSLPHPTLLPAVSLCFKYILLSAASVPAIVTDFLSSAMAAAFSLPSAVPPLSSVGVGMDGACLLLPQGMPPNGVSGLTDSGAGAGVKTARVAQQGAFLAPLILACQEQQDDIGLDAQGQALHIPDNALMHALYTPDRPVTKGKNKAETEFRCISSLTLLGRVLGSCLLTLSLSPDVGVRQSALDTIAAVLSNVSTEADSDSLYCTVRVRFAEAVKAVPVLSPSSLPSPALAGDIARGLTTAIPAFAPALLAGVCAYIHVVPPVLRYRCFDVVSACLCGYRPCVSGVIPQGEGEDDAPCPSADGAQYSDPIASKESRLALCIPDTEATQVTLGHLMTLVMLTDSLPDPSGIVAGLADAFNAFLVTDPTNAANPRFQGSVKMERAFAVLCAAVLRALSAAPQYTPILTHCLQRSAASCGISGSVGVEYLVQRVVPIPRMETVDTLSCVLGRAVPSTHTAPSPQSCAAYHILVGLIPVCKCTVPYASLLIGYGVRHMHDRPGFLKCLECYAERANVSGGAVRDSITSVMRSIATERQRLDKEGGVNAVNARRARDPTLYYPGYVASQCVAPVPDPLSDLSSALCVDTPMSTSGSEKGREASFYSVIVPILSPLQPGLLRETCVTLLLQAMECGVCVPGAQGDEASTAMLRCVRACHAIVCVAPSFIDDPIPLPLSLASVTSAALFGLSHAHSHGHSTRCTTLHHALTLLGMCLVMVAKRLTLTLVQVTREGGESARRRTEAGLSALDVVTTFCMGLMAHPAAYARCVSLDVLRVVCQTAMAAEDVLWPVVEGITVNTHLSHTPLLYPQQECIRGEALVSVLLQASSAESATYRVAETGSDSDPMPSLVSVWQILCVVSTSKAQADATVLVAVYLLYLVSSILSHSHSGAPRDTLLQAGRDLCQTLASDLGPVLPLFEEGVDTEDETYLGRFVSALSHCLGLDMAPDNIHSQAVVRCLCRLAVSCPTQAPTCLSVLRHMVTGHGVNGLEGVDQCVSGLIARYVLSPQTALASSAMSLAKALQTVCVDPPALDITSAQAPPATPPAPQLEKGVLLLERYASPSALLHPLQYLPPLCRERELQSLGRILVGVLHANSDDVFEALERLLQ
ncbi:hypothetical protein KIPB_004755 [Kipferlia bialata]|uniref:Uncharacterized protein n=1 Tax=Kipferlia bialata TaxID=797122 RepID=A0A9K3CVK6_9EUKA|nr:hypothetical protein KIPB_004755 [Kipferlia bialata]|eukprot:g4755.t1